MSWSLLLRSSEDEEEPLRQPPRKTRKKLPAEAKQFVWEYVQIQTCRNGLSRAKAVEHLRALSPDMFGHLHNDTVKNWLSHKEPSCDRKREPEPKLSAGVVLRLCEVFQRVLQEVPMTTMVLAEVAGVEVRREWLHRCLQEMNFTWKKNKAKDKVMPPTMERQAQQLLKEKLWFMMRDREIPWERVVNVDQTAVLYLPAWERSWSPVGSPGALPKDENTQITVCLA